MSRGLTSSVQPSAAPRLRRHSIPRRLVQWAYRNMPGGLKETAYRSARLVALAHRSSLARNVTFVGITGSSGKTTTKALLVTLLGKRSCTQNPASWNNRGGVLWSTLLARPFRRFHVQEVAIGQSSFPIEDSLSLMRARIAIVTSIGTDHISLYGSMEGIAAEKGKLVESLPPDGVALLNADDPHVLAMRTRCRCRVVTFGTAAGATFRAVEPRASWPDPLGFELVHGNHTYSVRTSLFGAVWTGAVLGAIAAAVELGVPIGTAIARAGEFRPEKNRMEPIEGDGGIHFIADCAKAPKWHFDSLLDFLRTARAPRKILVVGTISDYKEKSRTAYSRIARQALDVADIVIFAGMHATRCLKAKDHPRGEQLHAFVTFAQAADFLHSELRSGDLVVLKGTARVDDFDRLVNPRAEGATPSRHGALPAPPPAAGEATILVVGLGNSHPKLSNTPHNIGYMAVEALAASAGAGWERNEGALVATLEGRTRIRLVRLETSMNRSGPALQAVCHRLGAAPTDVVLIQDDISLPRGIVRTRQQGGDGGHKGVRSIVSTLGTDSLIRVKVGVGGPPPGEDAAAYVLQPFPADLEPVVAASVAAAGRAALEAAEALARRAPATGSAPQGGAVES